MTDIDPYGGLPSLERLEGEVRELAVRSRHGSAGRRWRRLSALGAVVAVGVAVSPAGPAFGGPEGDRSAELGAACPGATPAPLFRFANESRRRALSSESLPGAMFRAESCPASSAEPDTGATGATGPVGGVRSAEDDALVPVDRPLTRSRGPLFSRADAPGRPLLEPVAPLLARPSRDSDR